jgi:hypothetical protein
MIFGGQCRELTKLNGRSGLLLDRVIAATIGAYACQTLNRQQRFNLSNNICFHVVMGLSNFYKKIVGFFPISKQTPSWANLWVRPDDYNL